MNDYYYDAQEEPYRSPTSSSFTVEYNKTKAILLTIFIIFPLLVVLFAKKLLFSIYKSGNVGMVYMFVSFLVLLSLIFLFIFLESVGKKIIVQGKLITIKKWFIFTEDISLSNISQCEVITNLSTYSKYGSRNYNKIILHYNTKTISVTDDVYINWNTLRAYMSENGKAVTTDGSSKLSRFLENKLKK